jgi:hypothetical protein
VACDGHIHPVKKGIRRMRVSHAPARVATAFDEANLIAHTGLVPAMALAQRAGLHDLADQHLRLPGGAGAAAGAKVACVVAGMATGADCIDDLDVLRHGGMDRVFEGVRAPSTLGTFLRAFTFGHVRQLDALAARFLTRLAQTSPLSPGAEAVCFVDVDDTVRATYGYAKQGSGYGYSGVKGLNALVATASTPLAAPVILATRLRKGPANSARGAHRLVTDAVRTARTACSAGGEGGGGDGLVIVRADSAFYGYPVIAAARRAGARFSVTARMTPAVRAAITGIDDDAWVPIHYPNAILDEETGQLVSDAEVAETTLTAFTGRCAGQHVTARLIVRRVKRLNPATAEGQGELFTTHRFHAVFTDSPVTMLQAEAQHRGHAIIEQIIADLKNGPLAHLPSGSFTANAAWLVLAAITHNLTRAAAATAGAGHTRARPATVRAPLITVPARIASSARRLVLHLPRAWPWRTGLEELTAAVGMPTATGPPATSAA